jgi:hypothetical protein
MLIPAGKVLHSTVPPFLNGLQKNENAQTRKVYSMASSFHDAQFQLLRIGNLLQL